MKNCRPPPAPPPLWAVFLIMMAPGIGVMAAALWVLFLAANCG